MTTDNQSNPGVNEELTRIYKGMENGILSGNGKAFFAGEVKKQIDYCIACSKMKPEYESIKTLADIVGIASKTLMPELSVKAEESGRLRYLEPLHIPDSENNIMAIYFKRGTYVRPHAHLAKETYYHIMGGSLAYILFMDNTPKPSFVFTVKPGDSFIMMRGITHSVVILDDFCFAVSAKLGRYIPESEKTFLASGFPLDDEKDRKGKWITHREETDPILAQWLAMVHSKEAVR